MVELTTSAIGARAERRVAIWYRWRGWRWCAHNWIGGGGELDLVFSRWSTLLVVEVRLRATTEAARASVDDEKLKRVLGATAALVRAHGLQAYRLRLDLATVDHRGRIAVARDLLGA